MSNGVVWHSVLPDSEPSYRPWILVLGILFTGAAAGVCDSACKQWVEKHEQADHVHRFAEPHAVPRSGKWHAVRAEHLRREPACIVCGYSGPGMQVHHISPFSWPGGAHLELDDGVDGSGTDGNLCTVCGPEKHNCHLIWAHLCDFKSANFDVRTDAKWFREKIKNRPYKPE